ncbi:MAG: hypothetical protein RL508_317 [Actinomycetota bacterium]|mgnify:CR=1 FL=1|jgi:hypothetical protein
MAKTKKQNSVPGGLRENRVENTLAFMAAGVIGVSILSMIVVLVLSIAGIKGIPPVLGILPLFGLPIGFLLVFVLLLTALIRKARENRN